MLPNLICNQSYRPCPADLHTQELLPFKVNSNHILYHHESTMRAFGPPRFLLTPLHHLRIFGSPCFFPTLSPSPPPPLIKISYFHSSSRPVAKFAPMAGEHVTGDWFSVPDLRLRDHRFTIPLDYSLNDLNSPKISVFAREVVAGNFRN